MLRRHIRIPLENPFNDGCMFRGLVLYNGMKVILVSNPKLKMSGAALNIQIGFKHDPPNVRGLTHLLEHVITDKMYNDDAISNILKEDGGEISAMTRYDDTTYYFRNLRIAPTLGLFARAIFDHRFDRSIIMHQIKDLNSEIVIKSTNDDFKLYDVIYSKWHIDGLGFELSSGNKETLYTNVIKHGINIREELQNIHRMYAGNLMTLCVYGKDELNYLEELVRSSFGWRRHKEITIQSQRIPGPVENLCSKWLIVPTRHLKKTRIHFPLPDNYPELKTKPADYITHLVKHRGLGLLQSSLMNQGMCISVDCFPFKYSTKRSYFIVEIELTKHGYQNVDHVILVVFRYLELLLEHPNDSIYQQFKMIYFLRQINMVNLISREFREIAHNINKYPLERVLRETYCHGTFLRHEINKILREDMLPHYITVCTQAKECQKETDSETYWTKTEYSRQQIPNNIISGWSNLKDTDRFEMKIENAEENEFVWNIMPIKRPKILTDSDKPETIHKTKTLRIWNKINPNKKFEMYFQFTCKLAYKNARGCNLNSMFALLLQDSISECMYPATLADISCKFESNFYGIMLSIKNYQYNEGLFFKQIIVPALSQMYDMHIDINRFKILKEKYITSLKDLMSQESYELALYYLEIILTKQIWTYDQLMENVEDLEITEVEQFIQNFINNMFIECLISGHLTVDEVTLITTKVKNCFKDVRSRKKRIPKTCDIILEKGDCYLFNGITNYHKYSSTMVYYQIAVNTTNQKQIKRIALLRIIAAIIERHCYEELSMKEHLGYDIKSKVIQLNGACGFVIAVQGHDYETEYVESRINNFMKQLLTKMPDISAHAFECYKAQSDKHVRKILPALYNDNPEWQQIVSRNYIFDGTHLEKTYLEESTLNEICELFQEMMSTESQQKLSIHIKSQLLDAEEAQQIRMREGEEAIGNIDDIIERNKAQIINDIELFKKEQLSKNRANMSFWKKMGCIIS